MSSDADARKAARNARAAARRALMTVEVVSIGERKPSPYARSTPGERLAAAVRLIEYHQTLRGGYSGDLLYKDFGDPVRLQAPLLTEQERKRWFKGEH
jgi:hypothetical protein